MKVLKLKSVNKWYIFALTVTISVLILLCSYFYYSYEKHSIRNHWEEDLQAVTHLKVSQITQWRNEKLHDLTTASQSAFLNRQIEEWLSKRGNHFLQDDILKQLNRFKTTKGQEEYFLLSLAGNFLLSTDSNKNSFCKISSNKIADVINNHTVTFSDFYFCPSHKRIHIDIIAPVNNVKNQTICFLVSRFNPDDFLYPFIQSWPTSSKTAETILFRKDGDSVLFLNELRHRKNTALQLRIPITQIQTTAVQAVLGFRGMLDGKDYRGEEVIANMHPIPGTPWVMIAKIDKSEIYAELTIKVVFIISLTLVLILLTGAIVTGFYYFRQRNIYKELFGKEKEFSEAQQEYKTTLYSIGDGVITTDKNGFVVHLNPVAEQLTGWNEIDAKGKHLTDIFKIINEITQETEQNLLEVILNEGKISAFKNHKILVSKDGRKTPIINRGAPIKNEEGEILGTVLVFHDQTEERENLKKLEESENLLAEAQSIARLGSFNWDISKGYWSSSKILDDIFGIDSAYVRSLEGWASLLHPDWRELMTEYVNEEVLVKHKRFDKEYKIVRPSDGKEKWVYGISKLEFDSNNKPINLIGTISDITERKLAEEKIRFKDLQFRKLSANLPELIFQFTRRADGTYCVPLASEGIKNIFGCTPEDVLEDFTPIAKVIHHEDFERVINKIEHSSKNMTFFTCEFRVQIPGRPIQWIYSRSTPEKLPDGSITWYGFNADITRRKQIEEALKESELKYRKLTDESPDAVAVFIQGRVVYANHAAALLMRASSPNSIVGKSVIEFVHPDYRAAVLKRMENMTYGGVNSPLIEEKFIRIDGSEVDVEVKATVTVYDKKPAVQLIVRDITERKLAQENLIKLSHAVEQSPVSVVITNLAGVIEYVNRKFCEVTGYTKEEAIKENSSLLNSGHQDKKFYENLWSTILAGDVWSGEFLNKKKNGELFWECANISALVNKEGKITHFVAVKEDITEKKKLTEELIAAKDKAEEMSRLKSNFLANMSHELRTPLNGILGYSYILTEELSNTENLYMAQGIYNSGRRLSETLNFILDLSDAEAGKMIARTKIMDIVPLLNNSVALFIQEAERKNIRLETIIRSEKVYAFVDTTLIGRVFYTLLDNALKFTNSGKISIEIGHELDDEKDSDGQNTGWVYIIFRDSGIGIASDKMNLIWDAFRQESEGLSRSYEGTGLGLTITKKTVELMNGKISVESKSGVGSVFTVKFPAVDPLQITKEIGEPDFTKVVQRQKETEKQAELPLILNVEDDFLNGHVIKVFLKDICRVETAENGEKALKMINEKKYALILMDINLIGGISGLEVVKTVRTMPQYAATPIIAVTAYAMEGDKEKFLAGGCTGYLSKPFQKKELIDIVNNALVETGEREKS